MWPRSVKNFHLKLKYHFCVECKYRDIWRDQKCTQVPHFTFNIALEELGENAIRSQLMENTAEELLGHTCSISRDHHAEMKGKEEERNCLVDETFLKADYMVVIKKILFNYKSVQLWDSQNFPDSKKKSLFYCFSSTIQRRKSYVHIPKVFVSINSCIFPYCPYICACELSGFEIQFCSHFVDFSDTKWGSWIYHKTHEK